MRVEASKVKKMYDKENIFAKIIRGEIPCDKIYEDENILAFNDISAAAPVHVLVVPKTEYTSFDDFIANASEHEISAFFAGVQKVVTQLNITNGYRIISNSGADASQTVPHFHLHILAGKPLGGLLADDKLVR